MRPNALLRSAALSLIVSVSLAGAAHAGAAAGGAMEWTQILNNVQLVDLAGSNIEQVGQNGPIRFVVGEYPAFAVRVFDDAEAVGRVDEVACV
jgi:hypothetical protein